MISFTLKGKNFHSQARYWWPSVYYYENAQIKYAQATDAINIIPISQTTVHFTNVPANVGFGVGFYTTQNIEDIITDPYMAASTDLFVLKDGGKYVLDFHGEVGVPTLEEETVTPPDELPSWEKILVALLPWDPLSGPPLPEGFFPPWPPWDKWLAIPGYPKMLKVT